MSQPKSKPYKRKAAGAPKTPPPLSIGSEDQDHVLFRIIDWKSELSIRNNIPAPSGVDLIKQITKSWLALDDNPH
jgi:hypothetical protein